MRDHTKTFMLVCLIISTLLVTCCAPYKAFKTDKTKIICTTYPVYSFTREIVGDVAEILLLATPGSDPHSWEPSTIDMQALEEADLLISNGANLEPWLDGCLDSLENSKLKVCTSSENIDYLEMEHEHNHEHGHSHEHEEENHEEHGDNEGHNIDPHTWLSLRNAIIQINNITDFLCINDPDNEQIYRANANTMVTKITDLDNAFSSISEELSGKTIIVSHEAFGYLCEDYSLNQMAIDGVSSDSEPDAKTVADIIDYIRDNGIQVIFYDSIINPEMAEVICDETGCELVKLISLGTVSDEEYKLGRSYVDIMSENLSNLAYGLQR